MPRKSLSKEAEQEVLQNSRRRCALCFWLDRDSSLKEQGQIAHIDRDSSNSHADNLAYLCLNHHDQYDSRKSQSKGLTPEELTKYRNMLYGEIALWPPQEYAPRSRRPKAIVIVVAAVIFTFMGLLFFLPWIRKQPIQGKCAEIQATIQDIGTLISPAFPHLMCRAPIQTEEEISWQEVTKRTDRASMVLAECEEEDSRIAIKLNGVLTLIKVITNYAALHRDSYSAPQLDRIQGWNQAKETLGADHPLIVARRLEEDQDKLEEILLSKPENVPCSNAPTKGRWEAINQSIDNRIRLLVANRQQDSLGCGWMFQAERAVSVAYCGENQKVWLAEAEIGLKRANQLSSNPTDLDIARFEVLREATAGSSELSAREINAIRNELDNVVHRNAELLGEQSMQKFLSEEANRTINLIAKGHLGFLEWIPVFAAEIKQKLGILNPTIGYMAAQAWIAAENFKAAKVVLEELRTARPEISQKDYRQSMLRGKIACFGIAGSDPAINQSDPFIEAIPFETSSLAQAWGGARVLDSICAAANRRISETGLQDALKKFKPEEITPDICEALCHSDFKERLKLRAPTFTESWLKQCGTLSCG